MPYFDKTPKAFVLSALFLISICLAALPAGAVDLPEKAPVPDARPAPQQEEPIPIPTAKEAPSEKEPPRRAREDTESEKAQPGEKPHEPEPAGRPKAPTPEEEASCRSNLGALGVAFSEAEPVDDAKGCFIPRPISITTLGKDIAIEPAAELACATAETAADFIQDVVQPAAERHFGQGIKTVSQASAFVCRPRNGTQTLSEHAFGQALDIAGFVLEDGTAIAVRDYGEPKQDELDAAMFVAEVRAAACGPFKTVLGPGSDADHATHLHLDIKQRGGGYKVCE